MAKFLAMAGAAVALASAVVGPVVKVLREVEAGRHPVVRQFDGVAAQYREALTWEEN